MKQPKLFQQQYKENLTVTVNRKGVVDVDTVKGCTLGMRAYPGTGCYGTCYAKSSATLYGFDFPVSVSRRPLDSERKQIEKTIRDHPASWFRIGTMGDPCHDWPLLVETCEWLSPIKQPIIITKHWKPISDDLLDRLAMADVVLNTSVSGIDTDNELRHRLKQHERFLSAGIYSLLRLVSCRFGDTELGRQMAQKQQSIIDYCGGKYIDNPLRIAATDSRVVTGDIIVEKKLDLAKEAWMSVLNPKVYTGHCSQCPDQCGTTREVKKKEAIVQKVLFTQEVKFVYVETVLGSEYQDAIAKLAIEDGVAYRAARKNMQIHSAIVMLVGGEFTGFFTFQVNHDAKEFCLLQSAMVKGTEDKEKYQAMVQQIIDRNTFGYPMVLTCSTKHQLERPSVFEGVGFHTYLDLSGYAYMVHGTDDQIRMKRLAHATMTNAWTTTRADWLKMKKEWNEKIEDAGKRHNIKNPKFASRDGCWQGSNGMSNVVLTERVIDEDGEVKTTKGKSFNGNASVLDPLACEVILRFFMPTDGRRVYNPFGGGVQFGFVSGSYGYEYIASEIRQNQCDANNAICQDLNSATWIQSDSSKFVPNGKFDLCFTCPPYYKVEKYIDYDGVIPEGELNNMPTYGEFRDLLFAGYKNAIEALADDRFFVVMTGDSRDKDGAYYGCEAEHELFFRDQGLHIYNKITYLECEFTRLAHAKRTLDYRKFPKREQKILVFFKGDMKKIKSTFPPIGRL